MSTNSRIQNSLLNMVSGFSYRIFTMLTAFVVRTVFIQCLNEEYLGVNGLYSSILSMLSLTELGFGTAMLYSMYQPLAEKDSVHLAQLMQLYKTVYRIIGTVILAIGLAIVPFLDVFIKEKPDIDGLTFYYILFLLNSVFSYWFFAYRNSLLQADQKAHVLTNYQGIFNLVKTVLQIILLLVFRNFTIYLLTQTACTIAQNIAIAVRVKKDYPKVFIKPDQTLPRSERKKIFKDVKALMLGKLSFVTLNSSDNMIISAFVGLSWVGLLSNLTLISEAVTSIISQVTSAITASMGNFFANESEDAGYALFKRVDFLDFWLYGFSMIALGVLMNPFVTLWLGESHTMSAAVSVALAIRFFMEGFMRTMSTFRSTLGLFHQGQYRPIASTILNIVLSIALSYPMGVAGVLIATPLSRMLIQAWYSPKVILNYGFHRPVKPYYKLCAFRMFLLTAVFLLCSYISKAVFANGVEIVSFAIMLIIICVVPNTVFLLIFCRTEEFQYFWSMAKHLIQKVLKK